MASTAEGTAGLGAGGLTRGRFFMVGISCPKSVEWEGWNGEPAFGRDHHGASS